MFPSQFTVEALNEMSKGCMVEHLGIEFTELGIDYIKAKMPVDHRTKQPFGLLHGGASVVLSETMGSLASSLVLDIREEFPVGLEINANHIRSARKGFVTGTVTAIHVGKSTHVWETQIHDEDDRLICTSKLTVSILKQRKD